MADPFALPKRTDGSRTNPDRDDRPGAIPVPPPARVSDDVDERRTAEAHAAMPFARTIGLEVLEASKQRVVGRIAWAAERCTVANGLHGGLLMSLADTTGALVAFYNLPQGAGTSTIESKTNFLRGVSSGHVVATSTPLHVGRTTIVVVTDIHSADGKLVARVTQTQAVLAPTS